MIIRDEKNIDKNIWGKRCSCGNVVYGFYDEHLFVEENIDKIIRCHICNKENVVKLEEAKKFYDELIFDCFKEVNGDVLELGCGGGFLTTYLSDKKDVKSVEAIDNEMKEKEINDINLLDKCEFKKVDLNSFDADTFSKRFDYVVCKDVLMYLEDIDYTFSKLSKVSDKIILLNWYNIKHKNCLNKTSPEDIFNILKKYYNDIEIFYPSFYKWGYIIKTNKW